MSEGALAFDTTIGALKIYTSSAWTVLPFDWDGMWGGGDAVHTHTSDAEGGILSYSTMKFLTTPVNKISWTAATDWTDVDISADTEADTAKAALLVIYLEFIPSTGTTTSKMTGLCRKNGSSETIILPRLINSGIRGGTNMDISVTLCASCMVIAECDATEIFEVKLQTDSGAPTNIAFNVDLMGYFV